MARCSGSTLALYRICVTLAVVPHGILVLPIYMFHRKFRTQYLLHPEYILHETNIVRNLSLIPTQMKSVVFILNTSILIDFRDPPGSNLPTKKLLDDQKNIFILNSSEDMFVSLVMYHFSIILGTYTSDSS